MVGLGKINFHRKYIIIKNKLLELSNILWERSKINLKVNNNNLTRKMQYKYLIFILKREN